ncbi:MAG TPA: ABC transporter ATP-binding protein [Acidimicrobiales bacterium]|nr:ABC transporter ATP-binding protein [Acidimicrobiales bacterium]
MTEPILEVTGLRVTYDAGAAPVQALRGVTLRVGAGEAVGVVGESGSGKTTLALATLRLLPAEAAIEGSVRLGGQELVGAPAEDVRRHRGRTAAYVIQAPGRGFNPVRTIGSQIAEPMRLHLDMSKPDARDKTARLARLVELDPDLLDRYAHELSGGERQRAMLAMALACDPPLLVLDEPTSGLDSTTKAAIAETLGRLRTEQGLALLVISHDFSLMADLTEDLAVLYGGIVLEHGPTRTILSDPRQPYSRDLLGAYPSMTTQKDLRGIRGTAPDPADPPAGCPYHPRCTQAIDECATWPPELSTVDGRRIACLRGGVLTRLAAAGVAKSYRTGLRRTVHALKSVDLEVREGEVVGVVGETGSGKSTLVRVLVGVEEADAGTVEWEGRPLAGFGKPDWADFRRRVAVVFQDPFDAVSPLLSVAEVVREPLDVQHLGAGAERAEQTAAALAGVGLPQTEAFLSRRAHDLSGGQLQRVAIARALVLGPRLLIADEPTSMLDASEQAKLMVMLKDQQVARGMAMIVVSHDLALVRKVADRLVVLHAGEVVETGPGAGVIAAPQHPVTRALVQAAATLGTR